MTNPPTIIDRLMSLCIIYILVTAVLGGAGLALVILVPVFKSTIGLPTFFTIMSAFWVGLLWMVLGLYQDCKGDFDKIPGFFRKHWKQATWREEEVIEE